MKYRIDQDLERISLHDSNLGDINYVSDEIDINLDWGYVENYIEENISEGIIIDEARLVFKGVISQTFATIINDKTVFIDRPELFEKNYSLIASNKAANNADNHSFKINTFRNDSQETNYYVEWTITYKKAFLEWDNFILHKDWLNGKTP